MTKAELEKLAERYQAKAEKAIFNYQETGLQRYYREYEKNDDLATAIYAAANSAEEHLKLLALKADMLGLARQVQHGADPKSVCSNLLSVARVHGLIEQEDKINVRVDQRQGRTAD